MKNMKKLVLCTAFLLCVALFATACGSSAASIAEETPAQKAAIVVVQQVADDDFEAIAANMTQEMLDAADADVLRSAWQENFPDAGALTETPTVNAQAQQNGLDVVSINGKFENKTVTFTLSFDDTQKLAGFYFK